MKKNKKWLYLVFLIMVITFAWFIFFRDTNVIAPPLEVNAELENLVEMNIVSEVAQLDDFFSLDISIENNTIQEVFLIDHWLEYFDGSIWRSFPDSGSGISGADAIDAMSTLSSRFGFAGFSLPRSATGLIRIRQRVSTRAYDGSEHDLVVEFNLNE